MEPVTRRDVSQVIDRLMFIGSLMPPRGKPGEVVQRLKPRNREILNSATSIDFWVRDDEMAGTMPNKEQIALSRARRGIIF